MTVSEKKQPTALNNTIIGVFIGKWWTFWKNSLFIFTPHHTTPLVVDFSNKKTLWSAAPFLLLFFHWPLSSMSLWRLEEKAAQSQSTLPSVSSSTANAFVVDSPSAPATLYPEAAPASEVPTQPAASEDPSPPPPTQVLPTPLPTAQASPPLASPQLEPAPVTAQDISTPAPIQEIPPEHPSLVQPTATQVVSSLVSTQLESSPPPPPPVGIPLSPPALTTSTPPSIPEETVVPLAQALPASLPPLVVSTQSNALEVDLGFKSQYAAQHPQMQCCFVLKYFI